jgi:hypothetical protein
VDRDTHDPLEILQSEQRIHEQRNLPMNEKLNKWFKEKEKSNMLSNYLCHRTKIVHPIQ